ncbi:MAG: AAA family ATPase [Gemmatimonadaceae bacterium]
MAGKRSDDKPGNLKSISTPTGIAPVRVRVQSYGTCTVDVAGVRLGRNADVVIALLLLLSHSPGMQMPRDTVLELLWPTSPEKHQRGNLRQALYKLRQMGIQAAMHGDQVELDASQLEPTFSIRRDSASFEAQVVQGHEPLGPFLAGYDTASNEPFADWVENERERANGDARRVLSTALHARRVEADWVAAEPLARWLLQFDPLNEAATLVMSECLMMAGAKYEAIRLLDRYMSELGAGAADLRIPAATLRRRIAAPAVRRISFAPTERHFVGRESVMAELTLCMRRARYHDGTATLLHGAAGMGKTRVLNELTKVAVIEGIRDVRGGCRETDVNRPLSVFLDLVPDLLQMPGALGCSPESLQALRRFVNDDSVEADRAKPGQPPVMPLAAGLRRSIVELIAAVASEKPMLLVFEDAHWLDAASWEVIVDLVDRIAQNRVCLILTSRLPHARPIAPERLPVELAIKALPPLPFESRVELANAIATDLSASMDEELGEWFAHSSEGVPLFLRSLVNHWIETGDAGGIPPTLLGVIGQRVQNLSPDALHVLQTVTLLARHADLSMIEAVLQLPYFRVVGAIDDLHKAGAFDSDTDGVIVSHELIGRMAVDSLGRNARRSLHKRIADIMLERELSVGLQPVLCRDRLGHVLMSGDRHAFLDASIAAVRQLLIAGNSYEALGVSDTALEHAGEESTRKIVLALQAESLYLCGEYSKLLGHPLSPSSVGYGLAHWEHEEPESFLRWIDSAFHADKGSNAEELAAAAALVAESVRYSSAIRFRAATLSLRIAANACDDDSASRALVVGQLLHESIPDGKDKLNEIEMLYHTSFGDWRQALRAAEQLLVVAQRIHSITERLQLQVKIAYALRNCGQLERAIALLKKIHTESTAEGVGPTFYFAAWRLSNHYLDMGDIKSSESWYVEFERLAPIDREPLAAMLYHTQGMRIALARSDLSNAKRHQIAAKASLPEQGHLIRHSASLGCSLAIARLESMRDNIEILIGVALPVYQQSRNRLGQAFFAAELALCLAACEKADEGRRLLQEYVTVHRREPHPFPAFLIDAASRLNVLLE